MAVSLDPTRPPLRETRDERPDAPPRSSARPARAPRASDPELEAFEIARAIAHRAEVAWSLGRIAAAMVHVQAQRVALVARAYAGAAVLPRVEHARRVARAAVESAAHVAAVEAQRRAAGEPCSEATRPAPDPVQEAQSPGTRAPHEGHAPESSRFTRVS